MFFAKAFKEKCHDLMGKKRRTKHRITNGFLKVSVVEQNLICRCEWQSLKNFFSGPFVHYGVVEVALSTVISCLIQSKGVKHIKRFGILLSLTVRRVNCALFFKWKP